jgi:hypothetical protein
MKTTSYYYKHSNTFGMDFTAIEAPAYDSNPENDNHIPHGRH